MYALSVADISKERSKKDKNSLFMYDRDSLVRFDIFVGRFNVIQKEVTSHLFLKSSVAVGENFNALEKDARDNLISKGDG